MNDQQVKILDYLAEIWEKYPDLRFNQLVMAIHNMDDAWYLEDKKFLEFIDYVYMNGFISRDRQ